MKRRKFFDILELSTRCLSLRSAKLAVWHGNREVCQTASLALRTIFLLKAIGHLVIFLVFVLPVSVGLAAVETTPYPADHATPVSVMTHITAEFSEEMKASTITEETFLVEAETIFEDIEVLGEVSYNPEERKATFIPEKLDDDTKYVVTITTGVKDKDGNALETDFIWTFTTAFAEHEPLIEVNPGRNALALVNAPITATFDTDMDPESIQSNQEACADPFASCVNTFFLSTLEEGGPFGGYQSVPVSGEVTYDENERVATFTPDAPFKPNTEYSATITTGVKDIEGNFLESGYKWSFTTTDNPCSDDTVPPEITSPSPGKNEMGVSAKASISVIFSEDMDETTIESPGTFSIINGSGETVDGTTSYDDEDKTAIFEPTEALDYEMIHTATITTDAKDQCGNALEADYKWSFVTGGEPEFGVDSTTPDKDDTDVNVDTAVVSATFNKEINPSNFTQETFKLNDGTSDISGSASCTEYTATFQPGEPLNDETHYTATIVAGVEASNGESLKQDYEWSFDTGSPPLFEVISTTPNKDETDVNVNTAVVSASFNKEINPSTFTLETFRLNDGTSDISGSVSCTEYTATFQPEESLKQGTHYTATIAASVESSAGEALEDAYEWSFDTGSFPLIEVISTTPENGGTDVDLHTLISAAFNHPLKESDLNAGTFIVNDGSGDIIGTVSYHGNTVSFEPEAPLNPKTLYVAVVAGVEDQDGNSLEAPYEWSFTTIPPPRIILTRPSDLMGNVGVDIAITATFSQEMSELTLTGEIFKVNDGSEDIVGSVSYRDKTATFESAENLKNDTQYRVTITSAEDPNGNTMEPSVHEWSFTTGSACPDEAVMGDLNNDGDADLEDLILGAQICAGKTTLSTLCPEADVNGDGRIGVEEMIYLLRVISNPVQPPIAE